MRHLLCFWVFCFFKAPKLGFASTHRNVVLRAPDISSFFRADSVREILLTNFGICGENKAKGKESQSGGLQVVRAKQIQFGFLLRVMVCNPA